jgi:hypothetical protein
MRYRLEQQRGEARIAGQHSGMKDFKAIEAKESQGQSGAARQRSDHQAAMSIK